MMSGSVARRYARAILLIGQQHGNYDLLAAEIDRLAAVYTQSSDSAGAARESRLYAGAAADGV
jgi:F0F1-type ATP synthase delta subunit